MTLADSEAQVNKYTNTNTAEYTAAQRLIDMNLANNEVQVEIWKAQDEMDFDDKNQSDFPILIADLVASQQDYALETDTVRIKRVEISYDGTNWYKAEPFDVNESGEALDTATIAKNFNKTAPYYDIQGNSIFLYPIPDAAVTGGLKLWVDRDMYVFTSPDVTTGTKKFGFDTQFHRLIPIIMAREFYLANDVNKASFFEQLADKIKADLRNHYSGKQVDRKIILKPEYVNYN